MILLTYIFAQIIPEIAPSSEKVAWSALLTTIVLSLVQIYKTWSSRKTDSGDQSTRIKERSIESLHSIEQINLSRTDKLFIQYEEQVNKQEVQNKTLQLHVEELQVILSGLYEEVTKLRIENAYLVGLITESKEIEGTVSIEKMNAFVERALKSRNKQ